MRIVTFGILSNKFSGQDTFLFNMNKHMKNVTFDYVVVGNSCIHEKTISESESTLTYVRDYWKNPLGYIKDCFQVLYAMKSSHQVAYFNLFSMVHIVPIIEAKILGYKVVLHSHNSDIPRYKILHRINRFLLKGRKSFIRLACSSRAAKFMFGNERAKDTIIIHNAIDTDRFKYSQDDRDQIRRELKLKEKKVYGFVGRLEEQKNPLFLIEIFKIIHSKESSAVLLIIGEGNLKKELEERMIGYGLERDVIILGVRTDIERLYSCMDVFILPSKYEGLPIVLIETQAAGLNSVVSSEAVPKETMISDGNIEFLSIYDKPEVWAEVASTCKVLSEKERIQRNHIVCDSRYNIDLEAKRLEKKFMDIGEMSK